MSHCKTQRKPGAGRRFAAVRCLGALLLASLLCAAESRAGEFHNALSLQGFTGILNTPTAEVTDEGRIYSLYSNQRDNSVRTRTIGEESYLFSVGLFSIAELGGRLTNLPEVDRRDLSGNFKVKVPFIPKGYPQLAFGIQDISGGGTNRDSASMLRSKYVVATQELWRLRLSMGYGTGPDRMDGVFGGAELKFCDWFYLLGDYDTKDTNVGGRFVTPHLFGLPVNLQVTAKTTVQNRPRHVEVGVGMEIPLGFSHHNKKPVPAPEAAEVHSAPADAAVEAGGPRQELTSGAAKGQAQPASAAGPADGRLAALKAKLEEGGFQNVKVGSRGDELLVVEYENNRYNHNELDGMGVVAGLVVDGVPSGYYSLALVLKKEGIRVVQLSAPLKAFREFLRDAGTLTAFGESLKITPDVPDYADVRFVDGSGNPSWLHSSLVLSPGFATVIGSDYGAFDYLLSLKADYYLNLWKGAQLNARWDIPVTWSENYDDGKPLRGGRKGARFERLMLFQTVKPASTVMMNVGGGLFLPETYGGIAEEMWTPGSGNHRFRLKEAYFKSSDSRAKYQENRVLLGSYRYYFSPLDLYLEGTAGQFLNNDRGFTAELKRFFGDTAFTVYYKNSKTTRGERIQAGGVEFSLPLTPRRDMKPRLLQVRGTDEWFYSVETRIASGGKLNTFYDPLGINPAPFARMEHIMYNRDRLSEEYLREHLLRLRDAYIRYR